MTPITSLSAGMAGPPLDVQSLSAGRVPTDRRIAPEISGRVTPGTSAQEPFGTMVERFVADVDDRMKLSTNAQSRILSGESTNLHQAMISMQEASVAFSLMIEVRNKLVESYQEMMRMQV